MWIISRDGFVSLVQHKDDPNLIRARARRREHLTDTFGLDDEDIIDLGVGAPDYRWHADVPRVDVAEAMVDEVAELDYTSHVKESVSGKDQDMYRAMLKCWNALYELQRPMPKPSARDFWTTPPPASPQREHFDWDDNADYPDPTDDAGDMDVAAALEIATYYGDDTEDDEVLEALQVLAQAVRARQTDEPIADQAASIAERMLKSDPV
jgi:hypothetical protein